MLMQFFGLMVNLDLYTFTVRETSPCLATVSIASISHVAIVKYSMTCGRALSKNAIACWVVAKQNRTDYPSLTGYRMITHKHLFPPSFPRVTKRKQYWKANSKGVTDNRGQTGSASSKGRLTQIHQALKYIHPKHRFRQDQ